MASAEQFIERAGTESSQSGNPYRVRCAGREAASAVWLSEELMRYRRADVKQPRSE